MADSQQDASIPTVQRKTIAPPGVVPRNTQAWVIGGISLLMVMVIAFSGRKEPKNPSANMKAPGLSAVDPNEARIQEYRARIEEQARKLAAEQSQLAQTRQNLGLSPSAPTALGPSSSGAPAYPASRPHFAEEGYSAAREMSWIETDREKREYQSLFASNVALSYRADAKAQERTTPTTPVNIIAAPTVSAVKTGSEPNVAANVSKTPAPSLESWAQTENGHRTEAARERDATIDRAEGKGYRLFEGTVIETVLTNRLDGSFSGPVNCMVTTNVYSHDGQHVLIPQGSRALGEVKRVETSGQQRLAIAFHRLIMPDGYSVSLDQFHGLNQIGETGLRDQVNHHYLQIFGVSLAIGAIAGLSQANTRYGIDESAADAYKQGVATSLSQSSLRILDRYLNVLPTFTIREGHRVKVYLSEDLLLPAYEKHQMPSDL